MDYYSMVKGEETVSRYEAWSEYREELTDYILRGVGEYCVEGSWIAIWGAGGCNDIDVIKLTRKYKLLLIDQDVTKLEEQRTRLGLSEDVCKVADVGFWTIFDEDYEMFEALIMDGASVDELEIFFDELVKKMPKTCDLTRYSVGASVVVGLTSQLNSRFAGLLHLHKEAMIKKSSYTNKDYIRIYSILENLNNIAVERLYVSIRQVTAKIVLTGYEMRAFSTKDEAVNARFKYKYLFDEGVFGGCFLSGREGEHIEIAGNIQWHQRLAKAIAMDSLEDACMCQLLNWNFTDEKHYLMLMVGLRIHK